MLPLPDTDSRSTPLRITFVAVAADQHRRTHAQQRDDVGVTADQDRLYGRTSRRRHPGPG